MHTFEVGQKLLFAPCNIFHPTMKPSWWSITNVGRKWVYTDNGKFLKENMTIDVSDTPTYGNLYLTEEQYENDQERKELWSTISKLINNSHQPPEYMDLDTLKTVHAALQACIDKK